MENGTNFSGMAANGAGKFYKEKRFWLKTLASPLEKSIFPYDRPRNSNDRNMNTVKFKLSGKIFSRLTALSNASDARMYIILAAAVVLLADKYNYNSSKDVIVGAPINKQDKEGEYINKILVFRTQFSPRCTFKELLLRVRQTIIEASENQNYPIESLLYNLNISYSEDEDFSLFDIAILLENIHSRKYLRDININLIFSFTRSEECLAGVVEYNSILYYKASIQQIITHFNKLLQEVLPDVNLNIDQIDVLTAAEKKQLIIDFNSTGTSYPGGRNIHELIGDQAEKTPDITAISEPITRRMISYKALNQKANQLASRLKQFGSRQGTIVSLLAEHSPEVIIAIIGILKAGAAYLPLDSEYPQERKKYILEESRTPLLLTYIDLAASLDWEGNIFNMEDINHLPEGSDVIPGNNKGKPSDLAYIMYTSGSTGKPKGVMVEHRGVVNYVWWAAKTYIKKETKFPLYTSISFDLTVTSIFAPLITGNSIVVYGTRTGNKELLLEKVIDDNWVGVVKLTPSHLKFIKEKLIGRGRSRIKCLVLGGEELETTLAREISERFNGNIEIYNEYGPTEAVVGCMIYRFNPRKDQGKSVPIGIPMDNARVYLLNRILQFVPPGVPGELFIAGDGIARGYLNQPELTAEKFLTSATRGSFYKNRPPGGQRFYRTGDLARWLRDGNIEFIGRIDQQVKIRGFRIELGEIENHLLNHKGINDVIVVDRTDKGGDKSLCAYVAPSIEMRAVELREFLSQKLPGYMIPPYFVFLDEIPLTPNGKVDRKALPEPELEIGDAYIAPGNRLERKLVAIWSNLLGLEQDKISIEANFFALGGHSLRATVMLTRIHKKFNVRLPLAKIFEAPTIKTLSQYIQGLKETRYLSIEPVEEREYYSLAPAQERLFFLHQIDPQDISFNISSIWILEGNIDNHRFEEVFRSLLERHESLRTSFHMVEDQSVQKVHKQIEFAVDYYHGPVGLDGDEEYNIGIETVNIHSLPRVEGILKNFIKPFDLSCPPLLRVGLVRVMTGRFILMIDIHHIIADGFAQQLLIQDFMKLYAGEDLPPLSLQYKDYSQWLKKEKQKDQLKEQEFYWLKEFAGEIPRLCLPVDFNNDRSQGIEVSSITFEIDAVDTKVLREMILKERVTLSTALAAIYYILLAKYSNQEDIVMGIATAGRNHADLQYIVGMFVNILPVRNRPLENKTFAAFLAEVSEKLLNAYENQDYSYDELIKALKLQRTPGRDPLVNVIFTMQNYNNRNWDVDVLDIGELRVFPCQYDSEKANFLLDMEPYERDTTILLRLRYSINHFTRSTGHIIIRHFLNILKQVLDNIAIKLKDIKISHQFKSSKRVILLEAGKDFDF